MGKWWLIFAAIAFAAPALAQDVVIRVDAKQDGKPVSRYLTGACIEDVNREIYGGIYSQMIFGESFAEPPRNWSLSFTVIHFEAK